MSKFSYKKFGIIAVVAAMILVASFFVFGGPIFGPSLDFHANKKSLREFIYNCPRNEVRLRFYSTQFAEFMAVRVDLNTRALGISGGGIEHDTWGYFWSRRMRAVFHTVTFPLMTPPPPPFLSDQQLAQLKDALSGMSPDPESLSRLDWRNDEAYLAFYAQGDLQIHRFVPGHIPPQFKSVCQTFGFGPFVEAWNSGHMP